MSDIHHVIVVASAADAYQAGTVRSGTDPVISVLGTGDHLIERIDVRQPESQLAHVT